MEAPDDPAADPAVTHNPIATGMCAAHGWYEHCHGFSRCQRCELRHLLTGATAETIQHAGACDHQARIVELLEREPGLIETDLPDLSPTEAEIWRRVKELMR